VGANSTTSLTFRLLGKDESASKTINKVGDASDKTHGKLGRLGDAFGGLAKKAAKIAAVGVGAGILALGAAASVGFGEIKDSSAGIAQTNAVLKSTGGIAGVTQKQVEGLAGTIQKYSGLEDDAVRSGENLLLTFTNVRDGVGKNNDIFTQATKVMADMSVALGQDTKRSAIQLGKALNDPVKGVTALRKVGVSFTADQQKQIKALVDSGKTMQAQKLILAELNKEFGGSAKAFGQSLPGAMERAKRSFEDAAEAATTALMPAITGIGSAVAGLATKAAPLVTKAFDGLGKGISVFVGALSGRSEVNEFSGVLRTLNNLGIGVGERLRTLGKAASVFFAALTGKSEVNEFSGALRGVNNAGIAVRDGLGRIGDVARAVLPQIVTFAKNVVAAVGDWLPVVAEAARMVGGVLAVAFVGLAKTLPTVVAAFGAVGRFASRHLGLVKALAVSVGLLILVTKAHAATMAIQEAGGLVKMIQSTKVVTALQKTWAAVQWALNAAMEANPIGLVVVAVAALTAAIVIAWKKSEKFRDVVKGVARVAGEAFANLGIAVLSVMKSLFEAASHLPFVGKKFKGLANGVQGMIDKLEGVKRGLDDLTRKPHSIQVVMKMLAPSIVVTKARAGRNVDLLEGRASGGPVRAGVPYMVGEEGPELFVPQTSGAIAPYGAAAMAGAADVVVNVTTLLDGEVVYRSVQRQALRQSKRSPGTGLV